MDKWELQSELSRKEFLEDMSNIEPVRLYADEDVSSLLIDKINGYGFSIKSARGSGYYQRNDEFHIEIANREERCLIAQDKDYSTDQQYRQQIQYGLIVVKGDFSSNYDLSSVAMNCSLVLYWGKEFLKRAAFKINRDSFSEEYLDTSGNLSRREWKYIDGQLMTRRV